MSVLGDKPLKLPEPVFYFRVTRHGKFLFETAETGSQTVAEAYAKLRRCYPACKIAAVQPTQFARDGLPWFPGCESPLETVR